MQMKLSHSVGFNELLFLFTIRRMFDISKRVNVTNQLFLNGDFWPLAEVQTSFALLTISIFFFLVSKGLAHFIDTIHRNGKGKDLNIFLSKLNLPSKTKIK